MTTGEQDLYASEVQSPLWARLAGPLAVAFAYYLAAEAAFLIGTLSDKIFAPFWPPNAVLFCAFVSTSKKRWWVIIAAALPAHILAEMSVSMPAPQIGLAFVTNCALALLNAWSLESLVGGPHWFGTVRKVLTYVAVCAIINPALASFGGAWVPIIAGGDASHYWLNWSNWYVGNALAAITLAPVLLTWTSSHREPDIWPDPWRRIEAGVFAVALVAACFLSFEVSVRMAGSVIAPAVLYLPLPIILWGALRFGEKGGSGAILVLTVISISATLRGPSPFLGSDPDANVLTLQLFLVGIAIPTLLLTAMVTQLRGAEEVTRALVGSLLRAQDEERRHVARELHDSMGQNLAAASLLVSTIAASRLGLITPTIEKLQQLLRQSIDEVRTFSYLLHPPLLDNGGLPSALPSYIEGFSGHSGITVHLEISPLVRRLPRDTELALYRVVQEALTNISRHSRSETAQVRLHVRHTAVRDVAILAVEDNGVGMEIAPGNIISGQHRGIGLQSMQERIRQLGGRLRIASSADRTTINAMVPLHPQTARA